jgi:hypothetical protein
MKRYEYQARRSTRSMGSCRRAGSRYSDDIGPAMLKIARMQCKIFRARFGRDPGLDDPLFIDSTSDQPISASIAETCAQLMDAAVATRSDYTRVMKFLGLA